MTELVYSTMNVHSPKPWDTKHGVTHAVLSVYCWHVFCFGFLYKFDHWCVYDWKNYCIGYICIHKRVNSIDLAVSIKFCDESGLAILSLYPFKQTFLIKEIWNIHMSAINHLYIYICKSSIKLKLILGFGFKNVNKRHSNQWIYIKKNSHDN